MNNIDIITWGICLEEEIRGYIMGFSRAVFKYIYGGATSLIFYIWFSMIPYERSLKNPKASPRCVSTNWLPTLAVLRCAERARPSCIAFLNAKGEMCKRENRWDLALVVEEYSLIFRCYIKMFRKYQCFRVNLWTCFQDVDRCARSFSGNVREAPTLVNS